MLSLKRPISTLLLISLAMTMPVATSMAAVDEADISTFIVPSIVDRDPVVVAIGTEGTAPVLGQSIRAKIDGLLPHSLGKVAARAQGSA